MLSSQQDIQKMLAAQVHIGTQNSDFMMSEYIWRRNSQGVHIINIGKTWEKLMLAARIVVAIENPADVCAISARQPASDPRQLVGSSAGTSSWARWKRMCGCQGECG